MGVAEIIALIAQGTQLSLGLLGALQTLQSGGMLSTDQQTIIDHALEFQKSANNDAITAALARIAAAQTN